jgi:hypothetical protein
MKFDLNKKSHLIVALTLVSLAGFTIGNRSRQPIAKQIWTPTTSASRSIAPALIAESDRRFIDTHIESHRHLASKAYPGGAHITLASDQPTPIAGGREFALTATILSDQDLNQVELEWKISKDAELISGSDSENISIRAGEPITRTITLRAKSDKNIRIFAKVHRTLTGPDGKASRQGAVAQFNTNPEDLDPEHRTPVHELQFAKPGREQKIKIVQ